MVQGLGSRVQGLGYRVEGIGLQGSRLGGFFQKFVVYPFFGVPQWCEICEPNKGGRIRDHIGDYYRGE